MTTVSDRRRRTREPDPTVAAYAVRVYAPGSVALGTLAGPFPDLDTAHAYARRVTLSAAGAIVAEVVPLHRP